MDFNGDILELNMLIVRLIIRDKELINLLMSLIKSRTLLMIEGLS